MSGLILNLFPIDAKIRVKIPSNRLHNYTMDGVQNGDEGIIVKYVLDDYTCQVTDQEYWVNITRQDGTVCEEFLIYSHDMEVL